MSSQPRPAAVKGIPDATIARLPVYLHALSALVERGVSTVSSGDLAQSAGVNPAQLRKDLSYLGSYGTRGVGYDVGYLAAEIGRQVGVSQQWPVIIVGLGNLGRALANYAGFRSRGFPVVALVDAAPEQVGRRIQGLTVSSIDDLDATVRRTGSTIAVIAVPAEAAQDVCDALVAAGITSILNFAATILCVPPHVRIRKVDVGQEMQILAYHEQRKGGPESLGSPGLPVDDGDPGIDPGIDPGNGPGMDPGVSPQMDPPGVGAPNHQRLAGLAQLAASGAGRWQAAGSVATAQKEEP